MKIARVTDAWWLLAGLLALGLLLTACGGDGDEAEAEGAVDLSGTVTVTSQLDREWQQMLASDALQHAEEQLGFPVFVPEDWPWADVRLDWIELEPSPLRLESHLGNGVVAIYSTASGSIERITVRQQYFPSADEPGHIANAPVTFEVDGHEIQTLGAATGFRIVGFNAGPVAFMVQITGDALPEPEAMTPLLRSLIRQAEEEFGS